MGGAAEMSEVLKGDHIMSDQNKNISERAVEKLDEEAALCEKVFNGSMPIDRMKKCLAGAIHDMMVRFAFQDEEFAKAVVTSGVTLKDIVKTVADSATREKPAISDVEAYAMAVKQYLPAAQVTVSFRIYLPDERDDDLLFLGADEPSTEDGGGQAMILDLFGTED